MSDLIVLCRTRSCYVGLGRTWLDYVGFGRILLDSVGLCGTVEYKNALDLPFSYLAFWYAIYHQQAIKI